MTDTQKAGREMDAMVAEKVMGAVPCGAWRRFNSYEWIKDNSACEHAACYPIGHDGKPSAPQYSKNLNAAWRVVEKMHGDGVSTSPVWRAWLREWSRYDWMAMSSERAAEQVCVCALKAVGVEAPCD